MTTAFVTYSSPLSTRRPSRSRRVTTLCDTTPPPTNGPTSDASTPNGPKKLPVTNDAPSTKRLVRNKPGTTTPSDASFASARAGDMAGGPVVGEGMGPRRGTREKKVTRAAAIQKSQSFADAWAEQNQGKIDVWLIIGLLTLLTPIIILIWAVATGVIPTAGLFD